MRVGSGSSRVLLGLDRILLSPGSFPELGTAGLRGGPGGRQRVGLVTSDSSRSGLPGRGGLPARSALLEVGVPLDHLFTPEHGLFAMVPDGSGVEDGWDQATGLPVTSLYGPRLAPPVELLRGMDLVLFDLQDVGARFYTFLWTLSHVMESCANAGTSLWVLDRPNPLGGSRSDVEGPVPDPYARTTFLGRWPIPVRHSLTLGEMALLFRAEMGLDLDLQVVPMEGWQRSFLWPATGLPFVPPSPGIPNFASTLLYPGLALLEATNILHGRGTELSFQWVGTPWMDPDAGATAFNHLGCPGVRAHPLEMLLGDAVCPGVRIEVTRPEILRPVALGLRLLSLLRTLWPREFRWTPYPTATNPSGRDHLHRLTMRGDVVERLERDPPKLDEAHLMALTRAPGWWERATPHLLYS
ncbi:MAG: DUF1343 domain-containing protein [Gemmatimonadota bacterium]